MKKTLNQRSSDRIHNLGKFAVALTFGSLLAASPKAAAQTIDGLLDPSYGAPFAVQQNPTGWGPDNVLANLYYSPSASSFSLFVGGKPQGNAFLLFFDTKPGGQNVLNNSVPGGDGYQINNLNGFTFDTGFTADYMLRIYGDGGPNAYVNWVDLGAQTDVYWGNANPGPTTSGSETFAQAFQTITVPYASVTNGFEINMAYLTVGLTGPNDTWRLSAILGNGGSDYLSNQQLGSLPTGTGDITGSGSGNWNQNNFAGEQFVTLQPIPEPSTFALFGLSGLALLGIRRRR